MRSAGKSAQAVPAPVSLRRALDESGSLAALGRRLHESQQRFEVIAPWLPEGLAHDVRPGPIDDEGWSVLVSNAAVAAKLRHLLPRLAQALAAHGCHELPIRVRVRAP
jgi:hypothetical protein